MLSVTDYSLNGRKLVSNKLERTVKETGLATVVYSSNKLPGVSQEKIHKTISDDSAS